MDFRFRIPFRAALAALMVAGATCVTVGASELPRIATLLERYRSGDFEAAVRPLATEPDSEMLRAAFIRESEAWIAQAPAEAPKRRYVAAAFALELAQARLSIDNLSTIVLLDWASEGWRKAAASPAERTWTLAAVALVERGGRNYDLFPPPSVKDRNWGQSFVNQAVRRFPNEPRLQLAKATWLPSTLVTRDLERLSKDAVVNADALVNLAYIQFLRPDVESAMRYASLAASVATEPATQYMAHFILAFCHESKGRAQEAVREYSAALRAVPHAQSASIALASLLLRDSQAGAAFDLIDRSLAERADGDDPWRLFYYGGYVRWPLLIADVRRAIS